MTRIEIVEAVASWTVADAARSAAHQRVARIAECDEELHAALRAADTAMVEVDRVLRARLRACD